MPKKTRFIKDNRSASTKAVIKEQFRILVKTVDEISKFYEESKNRETLEYREYYTYFNYITGVMNSISFNLGILESELDTKKLYKLVSRKKSCTIKKVKKLTVDENDTTIESKNVESEDETWGKYYNKHKSSLPKRLRLEDLDDTEPKKEEKPKKEKHEVKLEETNNLAITFHKFLEDSIPDRDVSVSLKKAINAAIGQYGMGVDSILRDDKSSTTVTVMIPITPDDFKYKKFAVTPKSNAFSPGLVDDEIYVSVISQIKAYVKSN